jgi:hypothetical protein
VNIIFVEHRLLAAVLCREVRREMVHIFTCDDLTWDLLDFRQHCGAPLAEELLEVLVPEQVRAFSKTHDSSIFANDESCVDALSAR